MKLIVGLGNPGADYVNTRHNIGFLVIDELAARHGAHGAGLITNVRMNAWCARARIDSQDVMLVKPRTFMNLSGEAVGRIWRWHKLSLDDVLVVSDDIDLPFGRLRLRQRGSHGGHNGLRSIISHLQSQDFARLKVGVGRPQRGEARDHVLSPFDAAEKDELPQLIARAADAVELTLRAGVVAAMNLINGEPDASVEQT